MGLGRKFNKPSFIKGIASVYLTSLIFGGCDWFSKKENPMSPPGNGGYVEDRGITNDNGEIELNIGGQKFDISIIDSSDSIQNPIDSIDVMGIGFGEGIYGFSAKDPKHRFFTSVFYEDINSLYSVDNIDESFSINKFLNKIRGREYIKEFHEEDEPYPYNLSNNQRLRFLGTVPCDELYDFYEENDAIMRNLDFLEFIAEINRESHPELTFAFELGKFRQTFLQKINNYNDIANSVASLFGLGFEGEALYFDIYQNDLGVLTHQTSKTDYITLKGRVMNVSNVGINGALVGTISGPVIKSSFADANGLYFIKFLTEGNYLVKATSQDFNPQEQNKNLIPPTFPFMKCSVLNFTLQQDLNTLVLQPGPEEGKDAYVEIVYFMGGYNHVNENFGDDRILYVFQEGEGSNYAIVRSYLQFDILNIPRNSDIISANLEIKEAVRGDWFAIVQVNKILSFWYENYITWNNQPSFGDYAYDLKRIQPIPYDWVTFNITNLVQEWVNEPDKNFGLILKSANERTDPYHSFMGRSSDVDTPTNRPKLTINYSYRP
jgi:hypothetical protein